jgi:hypothetical protein
MESWYRFDVTHARMEGLVKHGLLRARIEAVEWLVPDCKEAPGTPDGYVMSFVPLHEHGLVIPSHLLLQGLLHHYQIELQHLNPNGI